ncbi:anti-sigma factor antagonist [Mycobacterium montefiorense]|uniref:Anti-sigma factor antagonist n=1 Tax=Mycobacterium montefiorense TaxID=154654 RepID=A0AA37PZP1_9MYCO|nr:anti-sigma factor antagonist [Mycobacterium montefiorense]GBG38204.1 anti-sigma factor antagonist [Mycobacterium montefiorense]GKU37600.1 anti-sigma factor antagonist [Mycobacterium montefiorense]GKU41293.1 anti-sigma factor antagonist [Mycobacterium montefiorense]GKU44484.1 anti-sigma factor antagonist [Mycobacterium montefiorense]GKU52572.1 anti-sigma factor antagonist [Mycobacterium montefiorense]
MKTTADLAPPTSSPHLQLSTRLVYELGDPHSTLRATTDRRGPAVLIYAGGEIDAANEQTWRHLVSEAASGVASPGPLIVDVTGLDFIACCAVEVLAEEAENCRRRGVEVRLVSPQRIVARIVDACGLGGVLPIYPTADSALAR